jgi:hypothetical protein
MTINYRFDAGHFALETHCREMADTILPFLKGVIGG